MPSNNSNTWYTASVTQHGLFRVDVRGITGETLSSLADHLSEFFVTHPERSDLTLLITPEQLKSQSLRSFWNNISQNPLRQIRLSFISDDLEREGRDMLNQLTQFISNRNHIPIIICITDTDSNTTQRYEESWVSEFTNNVISMLQTYHQSFLSGHSDNEPQKKEATSIQDVPGEPIDLKKLIFRGESHNEVLRNRIQVQQQINEEEEVQQTLTQVVNEVVTTEVQQNQNEQSTYIGELITYADFQKSPCREFLNQTSQNVQDAIRYELFGNLPQAIKYLTPEAGRYIARYAGTLAICNATNLLTNFIIKKTELGEMVLDLDESIEPTVNSALTPKPVEQYLDDEPIYHITLPDSTKKISRDLGFEPSTSLHNLWIRYGDAGISHLLSSLHTCFKQHPAFEAIFKDHFLAHFPHWDRFVDTPQFCITISQITQYDDIKLQCFSEFLEQTDDTQFNLTDIVAGFEYFWEQWTTLAEKNNVKLHEINSRWAHRKAGSPLVYMERLITILKNARDLREQLAFLDNTPNIKLYATKYKDPCSSSFPDRNVYFLYQNQGNYFITREYLLGRKIEKQIIPLDSHIIKKSNISFPKIEKNNNYAVSEFDDTSADYIELNRYLRRMINHQPPEFLRNYEDYYASGVEKFKMVSKSAQFNYDPEQNDQKQFNSEIPVYRVDIMSRVSFWDSFPDWSFVEDVYHDSNRENIRMFLAEKPVLTNDEADELPKTYGSKPFIQFDGAYDDRCNWYIKDNEHKSWKRLSGDYLSINELDTLDFRFIAQQEQNISLLDYEKYRRYKSDNYRLDRCDYAAYLPFLLFKHDKTSNPWNVESARHVGLRCEHYHPMMGIIDGMIARNLRELYKQGIQFGIEDGRLILKQVQRFRVTLNYDEINIERQIDDFFSTLQDNPYAMLRCLRVLPLGYESWAKQTKTLEDVLTNFEWLTADAPDIAQHYRDDMLLFCTLLEGFECDKDLENQKTIQRIIRKSINQDVPNNFLSAWQTVLHVKNEFKLNDFIKSFQELEQLKDWDWKAVNETLIRNHFNLEITTPNTSNSNLYACGVLKKCLMDYLNDTPNPGLTAHIDMLRVEEIDLFITQNVPSIVATPLFRTVRKKVLDEAFNSDLSTLGLIANELCNNMEWVKSTRNLCEIEHVYNHIIEIKRYFKEISSSETYIKYPTELAELFHSDAFRSYTVDDLKALLELLESMSKRKNYIGIFRMYLSATCNASSQEKRGMIVRLSELHANDLSSNCIARVIQFITEAKKTMSEGQIAGLQDNILHSTRDNPIAKWMLEESALSFKHFDLALKQTNGIVASLHVPVIELYRYLTSHKNNRLVDVINELDTLKSDAPEILQIIALYHQKTPNQALNLATDYKKLCRQLSELTVAERQQLLTLSTDAFITIPCLINGLENRQKNHKTFDEFISDLEKSPHGERLVSQFDISQVERVINGFEDLNQTSSYAYHDRKRMMEMFLFVNKAGCDLPLYNNKPAQALSDQELKTLFLNLKNKQPTYLDHVQRQVYALPLIREAMYRASGKFPYSTQMIALIDCMVHEEDNLITNIDTGEGKSLIDAMKASLLWLNGGAVDVSTASTEDAQRDLTICSPFFKRLGIPHSDKIITAQSDFNDYQKEGVNYSTLKQLALFYTKAKVEQVDPQFFQRRRKLSVVMNESDCDFHDDRVVIRYASSSEKNVISEANEWIYDVVNDFVTSPDFFNANRSRQFDIHSLRNQLKNRASSQKLNKQFIAKFDDKQLLTWIESAMIVQYVLKENEHYMLSPDVSVRKIRGRNQETRTVQILTQDNKISHGSQFGKGIQQLLCAKINKQLGKKEFILEPETRSIFSLNIKNVLRYYLRQDGRIWGGSGSVGTKKEVDRQHAQHKIKSSKLQPHKKKQVLILKPELFDTEEKQFERIFKELKVQKITKCYRSPSLILFKDIPTAERFYRFLETKCKSITPTPPMQLYTPNMEYSGAVQRAGQSGMITVTTSTFSRNTDIPYDYTHGLNVIETCAELIERERIQRRGRTGRQGSKGKVFTFLNREEFKGQTISELQDNIEKRYEEQRFYNEELYDILYVFEQLAGPLDTAFYKDKWSDFDTKIEALYRTHSENGNYNQTTFLNLAVPLFNEMMEEKQVETNVDAILARLDTSHSKSPPPTIYSHDVKISDCIPPAHILHHFMPATSNKTVDDKKISSITLALNTLLDAFDKPNFQDLSEKYLISLYSDNSQIEHSQCIGAVLSDFINKKIEQGAKRYSIMRLLGYEGILNQMTLNKNHLSLIRSLKDVSDSNCPEKEFDSIKKGLCTLLEEYPQYSWFVSKDKKNEIVRLRQDILAAQTIDNVIELISSAKVSQLCNDNEENKHTMLRKIKPVNFFGESRFQATLDRALSLASALSGKPFYEQLLKDLSKKQIEINPEVKNKTKDSIENMTSNLDVYNHKVLKKSLTRAMDNDVDNFTSQIKKKIVNLKSNENLPDSNDTNSPKI